MPHVLVDASDATVVVGQLRLPISREESEISRNKAISITICIAFWRDEAIAIVLKMWFQVRNDKKERRLCFSPEESRYTVREEVDTIIVLEVDRLTGSVPNGSFVRVRRDFQYVAAFPVVGKATAIFGRDRPGDAGQPQVPLAYVVGGITGFAKYCSERGSLLWQCN